MVARTKSSKSAIALSKRICARSRGAVGMAGMIKDVYQALGVAAEDPRWPALLERHLREAAQLAAVQLVDAGLAQHLDRPHADAQMLVDALAIEVVRHSRE